MVPEQAHQVQALMVNLVVQVEEEMVVMEHLIILVVLVMVTHLRFLLLKEITVDKDHQWVDKMVVEVVEAQVPLEQQDQFLLQDLVETEYLQELIQALV